MDYMEVLLVKGGRYSLSHGIHDGKELSLTKISIPWNKYMFYSQKYILFGRTVQSHVYRENMWKFCHVVPNSVIVFSYLTIVQNIN